MTESLDRTLITIFIIVAILAVIVYFTRGMATSVVQPISTTTWRNAPASAGTVVRAVSPVSSTRSRTYYSSTDSSSSYTTVPGTTTTTTYYQTY